MYETENQTEAKAVTNKAGNNETKGSTNRNNTYNQHLEIVDNDCPVMGFIRMPALVKLLGISKTTIYKEIREGRFPKQVRLSSRVSAWRISDLKTYFDMLSNESPK